MNLKQILIALSASAAIAGSGKCSGKEKPTTPDDPKPTPGSVDNSDNARNCFQARYLYQVAKDEKLHGIVEDKTVEDAKAKKYAECANTTDYEADQWADNHEEDAKKYKDKHKTFTQKIEDCYVNEALAREAVTLARKYAVAGMTKKLEEAFESVRTCEKMFQNGEKEKTAYDTETGKFAGRMDKVLAQKKKDQEKNFATTLSTEDKEALVDCYEAARARQARLRWPTLHQLDFDACTECDILTQAQTDRNNQVLAELKAWINGPNNMTHAIDYVQKTGIDHLKKNGDDQLKKDLKQHD